MNVFIGFGGGIGDESNEGALKAVSVGYLSEGGDTFKNEIAATSTGRGVNFSGVDGTVDVIFGIIAVGSLEFGPGDGTVEGCRRSLLQTRLTHRSVIAPSALCLAEDTPGASQRLKACPSLCFFFHCKIQALIRMALQLLCPQRRLQLGRILCRLTTQYGVIVLLDRHKHP